MIKNDQNIQNMSFIVIQTVNENNSYVFAAIPTGWINKNKTNVYWPPSNFDKLRKQPKSKFKRYWRMQNIHKVLLQGINTIAEADELVEFYRSRFNATSETENGQKKRCEKKKVKEHNRTLTMNQYSLESPSGSGPKVSVFK